MKLPIFIVFVFSRFIITFADVSTCDIPEDPVDGTVRMSGEPTAGALASFTCNPGKSLVGAASSFCLQTGQWMFPPPKCTILGSCVLPDVGNGRIGHYLNYDYTRRPEFVEAEAGTVAKHGENVRLRCNQGFVVTEKSRPLKADLGSLEDITCEDGKWSKDLQCTLAQSCLGEPPTIDKGYPVVGQRRHGFRINYQCEKGYVKIKRGSIGCFFGTWIGNTPVCDSKLTIRCPFIDEGEKFIIDYSGDRKPKSTARFFCRDLDSEIAGDDTLTCSENGDWFGIPPSCFESTIRCPFLKEGELFQIVYSGDRKPKSTARFSCRDLNSEIAGGDTLTCLENGDWFGIHPLCFESTIRCPFIDEGELFNIVYSGDRKPKSTARFSCRDLNSEIVGDDTLTCSENGGWFGIPPSCFGSCVLPDVDNGRIGRYHTVYKNGKSFKRFELEAGTVIKHNKSVTILCNKGFVVTEFSQPLEENSRSPGKITCEDRKWSKDLRCKFAEEPTDGEPCSCLYDHEDAKLDARAGGTRLQRGSLVKKGHTVVFECINNQSSLTWRNELRVLLSAEMFCHECQIWDADSLPFCEPHRRGDSYIVLNTNMTLRPGGFVEVQPNVKYQLSCYNLDVGSPSWHVGPSSRNVPPPSRQETSRYPENTVINTKNIDGHVPLFKSFLEIKLHPGSVAEYQCAARDNVGNTYRAVKLKLGASDVRCPELDTNEMFTIVYSNDRKIKSFAQYYCRNNKKKLTGPKFRTCQTDGTWSPVSPACVVTRPNSLEFCYKPEPITNGQVQHIPTIDQQGRPDSKPEHLEYPEGTRLNYFCDTGYRLEGEESLLCEFPGQWSSDPPTCISDKDVTSPDSLKYCERPRPITNGQVQHIPSLDERETTDLKLEHPDYPEGSRLNYVCDTGYRLEGEESLICEFPGQWTSDPPTCITNKDVTSPDSLEFCYKPGPITNGQVQHIPTLDEQGRPESEPEHPEYPEGTRLDYYCDPGYWLEGEESLFCEFPGQWSSDPPTCISDQNRSLTVN